MIQTQDDSMLVRTPTSAADQERGRAGFFSARTVVTDGDAIVAAFAAAVSVGEADIRDLLRSRVGASDAEIHVEEGFDDRDPFVLTMIPAAILEEMVRVGTAPTHVAHRGYRMFTERRFTV